MHARPSRRISRSRHRKLKAVGVPTRCVCIVDASCHVLRVLRSLFVQRGPRALDRWAGLRPRPSNAASSQGCWAAGRRRAADERDPMGSVAAPCGTPITMALPLERPLAYGVVSSPQRLSPYLLLCLLQPQTKVLTGLRVMEASSSLRRTRVRDSAALVKGRTPSTAWHPSANGIT